MSDSSEFGAWFGCELDGEFAPGDAVEGPITTPGYEHLTMEVIVERMEPEELFSFRWEPSGAPEDEDHEEATTRVEFRLDEIDGGTRLTVTESGFEQLPDGWRERAVKDHEQGWSEQMTNIQRYLQG